MNRSLVNVINVFLLHAFQEEHFYIDGDGDDDGDDNDDDDDDDDDDAPAFGTSREDEE